MSLGNWKGSSGWVAMNDPTGVLNGICLQASSGIGQLCEDYITQEIGTSNDFNKVHYTVQCDLAYKDGEDLNMAISMVARASNYTTSVKKPYVPQQKYIGIIDFNVSQVAIIRYLDNQNQIVARGSLNLALQANMKNSFSLSCYGSPDTGGTKISINVNG